MVANKLVHQKGLQVEERFWNKVDWNIHEPDRCWPWLVSVNSDGYGMFGITPGKSVSAHRIAYELEIGTIPLGFVIDHICHDPLLCVYGQVCLHRRCCNPGHMELVTPAENGSSERSSRNRPTHCHKGHEFTVKNTAILDGGGRRCRICHAEYNRIRRNSVQGGQSNL